MNFIIFLQRLLLLIIFIIISIEINSQSVVHTEKQKINYLLEELENSNLRFIRNGEEFSAKEAKEHMLKKLNYAGDKVRTVEQFIDYIASKSSFSGKPYYVLFPDGKRIESGKWLTEKLSKMGNK